MEIGGYTSHPLADAFPLIEGEAFAELVDNVKRCGLITPITLWNGVVLDGRNRLRACVEAGIDPVFEEFDGDDDEARLFVVATNLNRRHLTESQRAMIAARLVDGPMPPRLEDAAASLSVSTRSAFTARNVLESQNGNVINMVDRGEISLRKADRIVRGEISIDDIHKDGRKDRKHPPAVRKLISALAKLQACEAVTDRIVKQWPADCEADLQSAILFLRSLSNRTQRQHAATGT